MEKKSQEIKKEIKNLFSKPPASTERASLHGLSCDYVPINMTTIKVMINIF